MAIPTETEEEAYSNPVRLSVATRESNAVPGPSTVAPTPTLNERERLLKARKSNEIVRRKGEKWADKLMEETVDRDTFKRALRYITSQQYTEITSERHLNSYCSYPICKNPPLAPYNPGKKFKISTINRSITEVQGNKEEGYCTRACRVKSEWVRMRLDEAGGVLSRGKGFNLELVEDLGLDLDSVSGIIEPRTQKDETRAGSSGPATATTRTRPGVGAGPSSPASSRPAAPQIRQPTIPRLPTTPMEPTDLLANLHIHERPTPTSSSLQPQSPARPPVISHQPLHASTPGTTPPPKKRAPNAIVGEQSKLAQTVLQASKRINTAPQVNPDSEEEGEHVEVEWEREVGLGWGGGEEVEEEAGEGGGDLWEAMRAAQEIAGGE